MASKFRVLLLILFLVVSGRQYSQVTDSTRIWKKALNGRLTLNEKVRYYNKIAACYWYVDADSALWFGRQGYCLIDKSVTPLVEGYNYFVLGVAWQNIGQSDSSFYFLHKALRVFSDNNLEKQKFRAVEQLAENYRIIGKADSAIALVSGSLAWFRKKQNKAYIASSLIILGNIYVEQNHNHRALTYFLESASIDSIIHDTAMIGITQVGIGNIYLNLGNLYKTISPEKARDYYSRSLDYFNRSLALYNRSGHKLGICFAKMNLISAFVALKKFSRADSMLLDSPDCFASFNSRIRSSLQYYKAVVAHEYKKNADAKTILSKVVNDSSETSLLPVLQDARLLLATIDWKDGNEQQALKLATEAFVNSKSSHLFNTGYESACILSKWYKAIAQCDSSLIYSSLAGIFKDSLFTVAGHETMEELEIKYQSQLLNQQLTILQREQELDRRKSQMTYILAVSVVVVLLLIVGLLWSRLKRLRIDKLLAIESQALAEKEILFQKSEMKQVQLEKQLQEQQIGQLTTDLGLKDQDLVLQSLMIAQTNNLLTSLVGKLTPFSIHFSRKKEQEDFQKILQQLKSGTTTSPLEEFERLFKELHPDFYENICKSIPDLSQNDLHLCALLRLNLSSKDISKIANISISTVESARSRIRKKIGLDPGVNLVNSLMKF
jgi:tetratricopeptide (TPR) repeat protein/DNA-binding CsgD family transcriptional regulator